MPCLDVILVADFMPRMSMTVAQLNPVCVIRSEVNSKVSWVHEGQSQLHRFKVWAILFTC